MKGLFEDWHGTLTLSPLPELRVKVGRNSVRQIVFRGATARARIFTSELPGHDLIKIDLKPPYDEIYLRRKGAKRRSTDLPVVTAGLALDPAKLPAELAIRWDGIAPLVERADTPEKLLDNWGNQFSFRLEDENGEPGLRLPQIGALHAIAAHFAVGETFEPATVVLPTGTGKTETMLAAQVYLRPTRTLVLVSGVPLRDQIEEKFVTLGYLPTAGAVPIELPGPRAALISGGIRTVAEAEELLKQASLFIALPNSLAASDPQAIAALAAGCSHLFVDEAHHITANTWRSVRDRFSKDKVIQFGERYAVPGPDGTEVEGRLYQATVVEPWKKVMGAFETVDGKHILATVPIKDAELAVYRRHPDTFFGEVRRVNKPAKTWVDWADFFYESYQKTSRKRLLEFMKDAPDFDHLQTLGQKDLAMIYSERLASGVMAEHGGPSPAGA